MQAQQVRSVAASGYQNPGDGKEGQALGQEGQALRQGGQALGQGVKPWAREVGPRGPAAWIFKNQYGLEQQARRRLLTAKTERACKHSRILSLCGL